MCGTSNNSSARRGSALKSRPWLNPRARAAVLVLLRSPIFFPQHWLNWWSVSVAEDTSNSISKKLQLLIKITKLLFKYKLKKIQVILWNLIANAFTELADTMKYGGGGSYILLFSPSSHSNGFPVTSLRFTEYAIKWWIQIKGHSLSDGWNTCDCSGYGSICHVLCAANVVLTSPDTWSTGKSYFCTLSV